jgi:stage V sporulation protein B
MFPTAISEIIEALGKLLIGLALAAFMLPMGKQFSAAGAILGVSTGTFVSAVFMFIYNIKNKRELKSLIKSSDEEKARSSKKIFLRLMTLAIPITLGSTVFSMATLIDLGMIMRQLESIGFDETTRIQLYGYYAGDAVTMFNMPNVVITGMSISVVPAIAGALASGNKKEARFTAVTALRLTLIFAVPCAVGMSILSAPILSLLMGDAGASTLLSILAYGIIFLSLVMVTNSILQSIGKVWVPIIHMAIGAIVKIVVNFVLVGNPQININGAPIGTDLCYLVTAVLNLLALKKYIGASIGTGNILKIGGSAAIMGVATYMIYELLKDASDYKIALVVAIALAVVIYFAGLILLKGIKKEDVDLMPGTTKINKIIGRFL